MSSIQTGVRTITLVLAFVSSTAQAQIGMSAQGEADIESGANQASDIELGAGGRAREGRASSDGGNVSARSGGGGGVRLALQGRLDAINMLSFASPAVGLGDGIAAAGDRLLVPIVTPGVRLLDESRLFLGAGFGFAGVSAETGPNEESRSGWSFSPLVSYDVITDDSAAFSLLGWFNLAKLGETERCTAAGCQDQNNDRFGWGLSLAAGLRGFVSRGLAIGAEFGWGFLDINIDPGTDVFVHRVFGNIFIEGSIGL
jgi:opacity protein-like surface antigen